MHRANRLDPRSPDGGPFTGRFLAPLSLGDQGPGVRVTARPVDPEIGLDRRSPPGDHGPHPNFLPGGVGARTTSRARISCARSGRFPGDRGPDGRRRIGADRRPIPRSQGQFQGGRPHEPVAPDSPGHPRQARLAAGPRTVARPTCRRWARWAPPPQPIDDPRPPPRRLGSCRPRLDDEEPSLPGRDRSRRAASPRHSGRGRTSASDSFALPPEKPQPGQAAGPALGRGPGQPDHQPGQGVDRPARGPE